MIRINAMGKDPKHNVWVVYATDTVLGADAIVPTVVKTPTFSGVTFHVHACWLDPAERDAFVQINPQPFTKTPSQRPRRRLLRRTHPPGWFAMVVYFIPRRIGEPLLGDLLENRKEMTRRGVSRWRIEGWTVRQILALAGRLLWDRVATAVRIARRLE